MTNSNMITGKKPTDAFNSLFIPCLSLCLMSLNLPLCRHEHSSSFVMGNCPHSLFPHSAKDWGLAFKVTDVIEKKKKRGSGEGKKTHILCTLSAIFSVISLTFLASLSGQQQTEAGGILVVFSFSPQHFLIMFLEMARCVSQSEPGPGAAINLAPHYEARSHLAARWPGLPSLDSPHWLDCSPDIILDMLKGTLAACAECSQEYWASTSTQRGFTAEQFSLSLQWRWNGERVAAMSTSHAYVCQLFLQLGKCVHFLHLLFYAGSKGTGSSLQWSSTWQEARSNMGRSSENKGYDPKKYNHTSRCFMVLIFPFNPTTAKVVLYWFVSQTFS